jgi:hypothetical protein
MNSNVYLMEQRRAYRAKSMHERVGDVLPMPKRSEASNPYRRKPATAFDPQKASVARTDRPTLANVSVLTTRTGVLVTVSFMMKESH